MFMLKKTHLRVLARVENDYASTRDMLVNVRRERDRAQEDSSRLYARNVLLNEQIENLNAQIRKAALQAHAEQIARFKWGAAPAPEAQRAVIADRAVQMYGGRGHRLTGWHWVHIDSAPGTDELSAVWPVSNPATGRMPGAGSVKP